MVTERGLPHINFGLGEIVFAARQKLNLDRITHLGSETGLIVTSPDRTVLTAAFQCGETTGKISDVEDDVSVPPFLSRLEDHLGVGDGLYLPGSDRL
ncbi:hypothetical protein HLRTI_003498 [Halorhabdus tiamatea SARL4B]|uniref:Uncharacterized protein n=1 Tax=Halorhabdus tiamatea SARL4B TaxID=1033806 RepID=U2F2C0_9EURY|nr:hypothetical protein HLRTI_003498 [Halorhabdus tiamatea SARL4B]